MSLLIRSKYFNRNQRHDSDRRSCNLSYSLAGALGGELWAYESGLALSEQCQQIFVRCYVCYTSKLFNNPNICALLQPHLGTLLRRSPHFRSGEPQVDRGPCGRGIRFIHVGHLIVGDDKCWIIQFGLVVQVRPSMGIIGQLFLSYSFLFKGV
jgi:hypothetical protein